MGVVKHHYNCADVSPLSPPAGCCLGHGLRTVPTTATRTVPTVPTATTRAVPTVPATWTVPAATRAVPAATRTVSATARTVPATARTVPATARTVPTSARFPTPANCGQTATSSLSAAAAAGPTQIKSFLRY